MEPRRVRASPQGLKLEKNQKSKMRGGIFACAPRTKQGIVEYIVYIYLSWIFKSMIAATATSAPLPVPILLLKLIFKKIM